MPPLRYAKKRIDFSVLEGTIESNLNFGASDLDFISERRGNFLAAEVKGPIDELSDGQEILLKALSRQTNWTVFVIGISGELSGVGAFLFVPEYYQHMNCGKLSEKIPTNLSKFIEIFQNWYSWASS